MSHPGAVVANHSSWLDIIVLNAAKRVFFVSRLRCPVGLGSGFWPISLERIYSPRTSRIQNCKRICSKRGWVWGINYCSFPKEHPPTVCGSAFKSTPFAAFFEPELKDKSYIQAVTVNYHAPKNQDKRFYGWWGEMDFGTHDPILSALPVRTCRGRVSRTTRVERV